jgi:hypothetical protein
MLAASKSCANQTAVRGSMSRSRDLSDSNWLYWEEGLRGLSGIGFDGLHRGNAFCDYGDR